MDDQHLKFKVKIFILGYFNSFLFEAGYRLLIL